MKKQFVVFTVVIFSIVLVVITALYYQINNDPGKITLSDGTVLNILNTTPSDTSETKTVSYQGEYFEHGKYHFKLLIPLGFEGAEQTLGNASSVMIFRDSQNEDKSFQIFVTPYGKSTITEERMNQDLSQGSVVKNIQNITLSENALNAVVFENLNPKLGTLREVWFIYNDFLYEFSTDIKNDELLSEILQTLSFSD